MRRILGIDPGSRVTGYGVIDSDGRRSVHVASGCVRMKDAPFPARLGMIYRRLSAVIADHRPEAFAIEQVFMARNAASALKLGQARGAAICAGVNYGLEVYEYAPRSVKQALVGGGGADKGQVQHMVRVILSLSEEMAEDQSDALAVAICHAHTWPAARAVGTRGGWQR